MREVFEDVLEEQHTPWIQGADVTVEGGIIQEDGGCTEEANQAIVKMLEGSVDE